ncbi:MAG: ABC transporter permease [Betaproteobacteria bacterium]|nr:ABC transporter permease [Betaproteobacteria bacterium]
MIAWLRHHRFSAIHAIVRLARNPLATLMNIAVIGVALALPLGSYAILSNVKAFVTTVSTDAEISVFLAASTAKAQFAEVESRLKRTSGVKTVRFVPKDAALASLRNAPGMAEVVATLRDNPLPDAFIVTLTTHDPELTGRLEAQFIQIPQVAHIQADSVWVRRLDSLLRLGQTAVLMLGSVLGFALIAVVFNTIRLQILTQRDEIEVSKLIGATDSYIQRPLFYFGAMQGLLGGAAALAVVYLSIALFNRDLVGIAALYGSEYQLLPLDQYETVAVLAFSSFLGWLGAYTSVSRHLHMVRPQ